MNTNRNRISLELLIKKIFDRYEEVAEIYVAHYPSLSDISQLLITVNTGNVESYVEHPELTLANEVTVRTGESEQTIIPFNITVTCDGAGHPQGATGTTLYMADDVRGVEPRDVETGRDLLRQKLAGMCPVCMCKVTNLGDHFVRNEGCRESERV